MMGIKNVEEKRQQNKKTRKQSTKQKVINYMEREERKRIEIRSKTLFARV